MRPGVFFVGIMEEACERFGWVVHAYFLMDNHCHLVETPNGNLSLRDAAAQRHLHASV